MKKIILISCCSKKLAYTAKAKDLYISTLFKSSFAYAKSLSPDKIFILSAKYGLLELDDIIEPYDETLNRKKVNELKSWSQDVLDKLSKEVDLDKDEIYFLAGDKYRKFLIPYIKNCKIPLQGLPIGKQLQYLRRQINE